MLPQQLQGLGALIQSFQAGARTFSKEVTRDENDKEQYGHRYASEASGNRRSSVGFIATVVIGGRTNGQ